MEELEDKYSIVSSRTTPDSYKNFFKIDKSKDKELFEMQKVRLLLGMIYDSYLDYTASLEANNSWEARIHKGLSMGIVHDLFLNYSRHIPKISKRICANENEVSRLAELIRDSEKSEKPLDNSEEMENLKTGFARD